jgi:hypothetical protein
MRFTFTHNRKDDKPKCLISGLFPKSISVFHLSNATTKSVEVGRQTASLYLSVRPIRGWNTTPFRMRNLGNGVIRFGAGRAR